MSANNPHVPEYMARTPWYLGGEDNDDGNLDHQRGNKRKKGEKIGKWYNRGEKQVKRTKFRKGACENCGSISHEKKDCLERPKKVGAKWKRGIQIVKDEKKLKNLDLTWEQKQDRWNGFDDSEHLRIVKLHKKAEEIQEKRNQTEKMNKQKKKQKTKKDKAENNDSDLSSSEDEDDQHKEQEVSIGKKVPGAISSLRSRTTIPKYLRNLDPDSAYYDAKTRSMRENPTPHLADTDYAGDNFVRITGDSVELAKTQLFAWDAQRKGAGKDMNLETNPTAVALAKKKFIERSKKLREERAKNLEAKYGQTEKAKLSP